LRPTVVRHGHEARQRREAREPGADRREAREVEAALVSDVRGRVERDIRERRCVADEERRAREQLPLTELPWRTCIAGIVPDARQPCQGDRRVLTDDRLTAGGDWDHRPGRGFSWPAATEF
jgi:hypothetical protein